VRVLEADLEVLLALVALPGRGYWTTTQLAAQLGRQRGDVVASLYALRLARLALSEQLRGLEAVWRPTELGARLAAGEACR
jgi:hypothetical protein